MVWVNIELNDTEKEKQEVIREIKRGQRTGDKAGTEKLVTGFGGSVHATRPLRRRVIDSCPTFDTHFPSRFFGWEERWEDTLGSNSTTLLAPP